MDATTNKVIRQQILARALRKLLPLPTCNHVPHPAKCGCPPGHCECALELELCDCACEWTDEEAEAFETKLAAFYREVDPANYADPPPPSEPIFAIGRDSRIEIMSSRAESGMGLYHPDDISPTLTKNGEGCVVGMNGTARRTGAAAEPDTNFRSLWRSSSNEARRVSDHGGRGSESVDDLVNELQG